MTVAEGSPVSTPRRQDTISGNVLVTGGSGSLGNALIERGTREGWDASFIVYSRDEAKQAPMREQYPGCRFVLGDVRDGETLSGALRDVDVLVHAGALKRVPEAERNTAAYVRANVDGSMVVVQEALKAGVPRVIGISTDKASAPIGAYGQTKALMERLFQAAAKPFGPRFTLVRYGNVLASRGSVIPLLRSQAAMGGPLTITDSRMTRFWITLDDAVDLIIAGLRIESGHILIPKSRASSMAVLAEAIAPGHPIVQVGGRGGERPHEQLLNELEARYTREVGRFYHLGPLWGSFIDEFEEGFHVSSDTAPQFSVDELREVLARMDAGQTVRTIQ
jgi:UDP-N-acetylglucosamine 4,6-dehydratase